MGKPAHPRKAELTSLRASNQLATSGAVPVTSGEAGKKLLFEMEAPGFVYFEIA
jgi:hypothetical protein